MALEVGQVAPNIRLYSDDKELFDLSENRGTNVLLLFFPAAFTGVCTTELNTVNNDLDRYQNANVDVVGISTDSPFSLAEFKKVNALTFPLLSDHNTEASEAYGTKYEVDGAFPFGLHRLSKRSAFLVDAEGVIRYAEVLEVATDQPDFEAIDAAIEAL